MGQKVKFSTVLVQLLKHNKFPNQTGQAITGNWRFLNWEGSKTTNPERMSPSVFVQDEQMKIMGFENYFHSAQEITTSKRVFDNFTKLSKEHGENLILNNWMHKIMLDRN